MIGDMRSQLGRNAHAALPDPQEARVARDRVLALAYVKKGKGRNAASEVAKEMGTHRFAIYRALKRELAWAEAEFEKESHPANCTGDRGDEGPLARPQANSTTTKNEGS
jgi:hypothetical protein